MTVAAPPRPPRPSAPVEREDLEALIEEARQRARRRRQTYAAIVAIVALAGVAVVTVFERTAQSQSGSPALGAPASLTAGTAGSKIAFIYNDPYALPHVAEPFQDWDLHVMNADGSGKRPLTRNASIQIDMHAWSPDGRRLVFIRGSTGTFNGSISVMNVDGSGEQTLTGGSWLADPAWSPDGRKIAFRSARRYVGFDVYVMNADGSGRRNLTRGLGIGSGGPAGGPYAWGPGLSWSPDGRKIAFTSARSYYRDGFEVYVMNADGSGLRNLTRKPGDDHFAAWSPDGRKIAFTSYRDWNSEVYVMNADGSGQRRLTRSTAQDANPAWSPDGRRIAFGRGGERTSEIFVMNADGSGQRRLARGAGWIDPAWSPDGRMIAFSGSDIYVVNADGSRQRNLTRTPRAREPWFAWSPGQRK